MTMARRSTRGISPIRAARKLPQRIGRSRHCPTKSYRLEYALAHPQSEACAMTRRAFLAMPAILRAAPASGARIDDLQIDFADFRYRAPYKFGGREVDKVTMLNVRCRLSTRDGKSAEG